jgi:dinuclear metal center YbgI/SA1388 family protein
MASRDAIVAYADELLEVHKWPEFGPAGLQVVGARVVSTIVCGVSCSRELFEAAVAARAEMVLVHHGLFWRNEPLVVDGRLRGRLEALFRGDCSLVAYHLPLDAHPVLGNSAQLATALGGTVEGSFAGVGVACTLTEVPVEQLLDRVGALTGRAPQHLPGGPGRVRRIAVSTGAAGYELIRAAHEGFDLLLTGEPEEPNAATARELGIHLVAAGHHATERLGVQALAAHLADRFDLTWQFIDVDNPV